MAKKKTSGYVTTMVCVTCGAEQFFDDAVPASLTCPKCHSTVFREFSTPTEPDEAAIAQLEEQARSISYGDSSPTTSADDVRDLES
jgi:DNA-directed RNA polymerase subunit RPC12/RpoP